MIPDSCKPYVKLVDHLVEAPKLIASAAKLTISNKEFGEILDSMSEEKMKEWIGELIRRGHGSPLEHSIYVFEIICSRVTSHQLIRHRIASYTQLSQRYKDSYLHEVFKELLRLIDYRDADGNQANRVALLDEILARTMEWDKYIGAICKSFVFPPMFRKNPEGFIRTVLLSMKTYYEAIENGMKYEDARYIIPQCVKTRLLVSMNARELIEVFIPLRTCIKAQWEIRHIAWRMREELTRIHPEIFRYTGPRCILINNRVSNKIGSFEDYVEGNVEIVIPRCPELVPREKIRECILNSAKDPWTQH